MYSRYVKRFLDVVLSVVGILSLAVPMLLIALLLNLSTPGCVIFKQKRSGRANKPFEIYKFRTMPLCVPGYIASSELERVSWSFSWLQEFLRKTSLDELPQLFNIIKGEMSFVGPRPVIYEENELLEERERYGVNRVRPGLSGYAQLYARNEIDYKKKVFLDKWYVENISFGLDVKIFFRSFLEILKCDGI